MRLAPATRRTKRICGDKGDVDEAALRKDRRRMAVGLASVMQADKLPCKQPGDIWIRPILDPGGQVVYAQFHWYDDRTSDEYSNSAGSQKPSRPLSPQSWRGMCQQQSGIAAAQGLPAMPKGRAISGCSDIDGSKSGGLVQVGLALWRVLMNLADADFSPLVISPQILERSAGSFRISPLGTRALRPPRRSQM